MLDFYVGEFVQEFKPEKTVFMSDHGQLNFKNLIKCADPKLQKEAFAARDNCKRDQYKSIIGKSWFCVAARTHACIAAYSSFVPTLALGYSSKAQGIAQDLGMSDYVIETMSIKSGMELVDKLKTMVANESSITVSLNEIMLSHKQNVASIEVLKHGGIL